ncbi:MAG: hemin uptake protein HemP [Gammaproteobacteria bacterium]|nr:hemin uptake protein HemP [Gammaproteobacteria bacterium]MBU1644966.1 hemin uptake protein HemP [Gammaproteobacteria bacterium]MBU1971425.1 hemin uptake protein HemP [Gammaproteobacteria bacterium]
MNSRKRLPANAAEVASDKFGLAASNVAPRRIDAATLFAAGPEIVITHGLETYRLRLTRQNRLILTK